MQDLRTGHPRAGYRDDDRHHATSCSSAGKTLSSRRKLRIHVLKMLSPCSWSGMMFLRKHDEITSSTQHPSDDCVYIALMCHVPRETSIKTRRLVIPDWIRHLKYC